MLTKLTDDLWCVEHNFKIGGAPFSSKMTLAWVKDAWVALSAVPLSPELLLEVRKKGEITHIIAPNNFHHLFITDLLSLFPDAQLYIPKSLQKKRPDLNVSAYLDIAEQFPWQPELELYAFDGMKMLEEFHFFHTPSKTLIITDVCFNLPEDLAFGTKLFAKITGTFGGLKTSRIQKFLMRDKNASKKSIERLLECDIQHLVLAHGDCIKENAKEELSNSFQWLLQQ